MNTVIKYLRKINSIVSALGSNGSALIPTIVSITVVASLAAVVASILSSSANVTAGANLSTKVYYLAESGIRYVDPPDALPVEAAVNGPSGCMNQSNPSQCLQNLASCLNQPTSQCLASNPAYINPGYQHNTYTLDNGNTTIAMAASYIAGTPQKIRLTSTATVNPGTSSESKQMLNYDVTAVAQTSSTYTDNFNSTAKWTAVEGNLSTPQSFTVNGVAFKAESPAANYGDNKSVITFNNTGQNLVKLTTNGLANYIVQFKCKVPASYGGGQPRFAISLTFQLNSSDGSSYGVAFMGGSGNLGSYLQSVLGPIASDGNLYVILWKVDAWGNDTLLDYRRVTTSDGITTDGQNLTDWSTLMVQLKQYTVAGSTQNEINVFVQGPASYGPGTAIVWDLSKFNPVTWACPGTSPVNVGYSSDSCGSSTTWSGGHTRNLLDMVAPTSSNGHYYECETAGTSGTTQPAWPTGYHSTVSDGAVQWMESKAYIDSSCNPNDPQIGLHSLVASGGQQAYFADFSVQGTSSGGSGGGGGSGGTASY